MQKPEKSQLDTLEIYLSMILPRERVGEYVRKFAGADATVCQNALQLLEGSRRPAPEALDKLFLK
jgi:hypothetical protein